MADMGAEIGQRNPLIRGKMMLLRKDNLGTLGVEIFCILTASMSIFWL